LFSKVNAPLALSVSEERRTSAPGKNAKNVGERNRKRISETKSQTDKGERLEGRIRYTVGRRVEFSSEGKSGGRCGYTGAGLGSREGERSLTGGGKDPVRPDL